MILVSTAVLCALAPLHGVSFALVALTAFSLKQLPSRVRHLVIAASVAVFVIGAFEVVTNGSQSVTTNQPQDRPSLVHIDKHQNPLLQQQERLLV